MAQSKEKISLVLMGQQFREMSAKYKELANQISNRRKEVEDLMAEPGTENQVAAIYLQLKPVAEEAAQLLKAINEVHKALIQQLLPEAPIDDALNELSKLKKNKP